MGVISAAGGAELNPKKHGSDQNVAEAPDLQYRRCTTGVSKPSGSSGAAPSSVTGSSVKAKKLDGRAGEPNLGNSFEVTKIKKHIQRYMFLRLAYANISFGLWWGRS
jgi:hypothetical protein